MSRAVFHFSGAVGDAVEREGRIGSASSVFPGAAGGVEDVVGDEFPAVFGDEVDGLEDEGEDFFGDEVVEVDADPAGFDAFASADDFAFEFLGGGQVDAEEAVSVGSRAGAAAAGLDAEEVVQEGDDEVVVEELVVVFDHERHDREPPGVEVSEDSDVGVVTPAFDGALDEVVFEFTDVVFADGGFELEDESGADGFDDGGRAAFFAVDGVVEVAVVGFVDVGDGAAAGA